MSGQIAALRERDNLKVPDQVSVREKPMRRREFVTFVAGSIVTWPFASIALEAGRI
jgi:nitrate reductase NapE component